MLSYTLLTGALAAVFVGLVLLTNRCFRSPRPATTPKRWWRPSAPASARPSTSTPSGGAAFEQFLQLLRRSRQLPLCLSTHDEWYEQQAQSVSLEVQLDRHA